MEQLILIREIPISLNLWVSSTSYMIIHVLTLMTNPEMLNSLQVQYHSMVPPHTVGEIRLNGNFKFQQASWFLCVGKMLNLVTATYTMHIPCNDSMKTNRTGFSAGGKVLKQDKACRKSKTESWKIELRGIAKPGDNVQQVCKQKLFKRLVWHALMRL